jgi:hypothetical protein
MGKIGMPGDEVKTSFYFYVLTLLAIAPPVFGQAVSECRLQSDPQMRLACYDAVYPPGKLPPNQPPGETNRGKPEFTYSWAGVPSCRSLSKSPAFKFSNFPSNTRSVLLVLTQGEREFGGQEITFPITGLVPEGAISMRGPCVPGTYRWTATMKSATGEILATLHADSHFPAE